MKLWLSNATKRRVVQELRKILYDHPRYRADSGNVQNKFAFTERPQRGIIVNNTSADRVVLSADNYMGRLSSFCMLDPIPTKPSTSIEWVRENDALLEQFSARRDIFPTPPGVYRIKIATMPDDGRNVPGTFTVDPILTVKNEPLIIFNTTAPGDAQLPNDNIYPGAVQLWLDGRRQLLENVDFSVDYSSGRVTFLKSTPVGSTVYADYRHIMPTQGPFQFQLESYDVAALPGVVIAFGDRVQECDEMSIVITDDRTDVADIYGGKFEINFDLLVIARDSEDRDKMSDYVIGKILERQNSLGYEGLELLDISPGGEEEEVYNAETDDYYYQSSVSLRLRVDWEIGKSLPVVVYRVEQTSASTEQKTGYMDGTAPYDLIRVGQNPFVTRASLSNGHNLGFERMR